MSNPSDSDLISIPHYLSDQTNHFELIEITDLRINGAYVCGKTHNRFEVRINYGRDEVAWFSVLANQPYIGSRGFFAQKNCGFTINVAREFASIEFRFKSAPDLDCVLSGAGERHVTAAGPRSDASGLILFDVSDLIYYIGHHDSLSGIQRVQASVLLGLMEACPEQQRRYIAYDNRDNDFYVLDSVYFEALLADLSRPVQFRKIEYDRQDARLGILPKSAPIAAELPSDPN